MTDKDQHIDNIIKSKVESRTFDSPPSDFLDDLNKRLDKREKSSKSSLWNYILNLLFIALLVINSVFDFSENKLSEQTSNDENKIVQNESQVEQNKTQTETETQDESGNNLKVGEDDKTNKKSNELISSSANDDSKSGSEVQNDISNLNDKNQTSKSTSTKNNNRKTKNTTAGNDSNNSEQDKSTKKTNNGSVDNSNTANKEVKSENQNSDSGNKASQSKNEGNSDFEEDNIKPEEGLIASNYIPIYASDFDNVDELFKLKRIPTVSKNKSPLLPDSSLTQEPEQTSNSQKDPLKLELQLFGGASKLGFLTNSANNEFKNQLDEDGTSLWTPTFGININTYHKKIAFGTGVSFLSVKEENTFEFTDVSSYDSTYIAGYDQTITYDSLGNPIDTTYTPYYDSTTITDTTFTNNIIQNQYSWIQIPINIGYRFQINQWAIIPRLGMNIGIGINNSDVNYPDENYDQMVSAPPLTWNLSLQPSLEIRRDLGNWHVYTRLDYRRNLTPAVEYNWFDRRYQGGMVRLGVGYTFEFERGR